MILEEISTLAVEEVNLLKDTTRGAAGFGSTRMQTNLTNSFGGNLGILLSAEEEQSTPFKTKNQDQVQINSLKRLEGSNKHNTPSQTIVSKQRYFLSIKVIKKVAKIN